MKRCGICIPSVDVKDIFLSHSYIDDTEHKYTLRNSKGEFLNRKFVNTYEYSLDLIQILNAYEQQNEQFFWEMNGRLYTNQIINLTFKYSVKEWNQYTHGIFVKFGYCHNRLKYNNGIALMIMVRLLG